MAHHCRHESGGQNNAIAADPIYFPRVSTILPHMLNGGWSSTVDASKFFYQFKTLLSERRYLGLVHPANGEHLLYDILPMGSSNSTAAACCLGNAFCRLLVKRTLDLFHGKPISNTWASRSSNKGYDSYLGHGRVLLGLDGLPATLLWEHVDDLVNPRPDLWKD
jgi:hypothetical protein